MGPKPKGQRAEKQATTFKAIDDFLEKSSVAPGEVRDQLASAHEE